MIAEMRISGLGVIDKAVLDFAPGLTVLTGETGAGKTMVLTSLRLLLGDKGDAGLIREGHPQIEVDGIIEPTTKLRRYLEELGIKAVDEEIIISRTVPRSGRSRATIEGRPVPLRVLGDTVGGLVTIHGQADQWRVRQATTQRHMLDQYAGAGHNQVVEAYQSAWREAVEAKRHLDEIREGFDQRQVEIQYLSEVTEAIDTLDPSVEEEEALDREIDCLTNAAELGQDVNSALGWLSGEGPVAEGLGQALAALRKAMTFDAGLESFLNRVEVLGVEANTLGEELGNYLELLRDDPQQLDELVRRRSDLESLLRGRATTVAELLEWNETAKKRLDELQSAESDPETAAEMLRVAQKQVLECGSKLRVSRQKAAKGLEKAVARELQALAMPNATFRIVVEETKPGANGADEVRMELQPHPDAPFRALGEGASGGELSRLMLALEVALGQRAQGGTYVFDEVDAGIGGQTATEVGKRLAKLAQNQQVVVVTHLPQVAAFADTHLVVAKNDGKTVVEEVSAEKRVDEIVRMLGGEGDSVAARRHALELLERNGWKNRGSGSEKQSHDE